MTEIDETIARLDRPLYGLTADDMTFLEEVRALIVRQRDALARLQAEIERKDAALRPFASVEMPPQEPDHWPAFGKSAGQGWPTVGDFRRARAILSTAPTPAAPAGEAGRFAAFVQRHCANPALSDAEKISIIANHPTIRALAQETSNG